MTPAPTPRLTARFQLRCRRCGYLWTSRFGRPLRCARTNCRSPYWDREPGETQDAVVLRRTRAAAADAVEGRTTVAATRAAEGDDDGQDAKL